MILSEGVLYPEGILNEGILYPEGLLSKGILCQRGNVRRDFEIEPKNLVKMKGVLYYFSKMKTKLHESFHGKNLVKMKEVLYYFA